MHDLAATWPVQPDWRDAAFESPGLSVRTLHDLDQHLVSGDFAAWRRGAEFPGEEVGGFGLALGDRYSVRLARDRLLAVGRLKPAAAESFAVTQISAGLLVFEMRGALTSAIIARATALDPANPSPSAAMNFAGAQAIVYRHRDVATLRIHIDRSMGAHFWTWLAAVVENISPAESRVGEVGER